jgi:hypothetical protein
MLPTLVTGGTKSSTEACRVVFRTGKGFSRCCDAQRVVSSEAQGCSSRCVSPPQAATLSSILGHRRTRCFTECFIPCLPLIRLFSDGDLRETNHDTIASSLGHMSATPHRNVWVVTLRHCALLFLLTGVGIGVYWFACEPDREWPSRTMHYKDLMIIDSPNLAAEQRRITISDTTRILVGSCVLGFIGVGVIRVIKSWRKSLA